MLEIKNTLQNITIGASNNKTLNTVSKIYSKLLRLVYINVKVYRLLKQQKLLKILKEILILPLLMR